MDTTSPISIEHAAEMLWKAEKSGRPCTPVRRIIGESDLELAYRVQDLISGKKIAVGAIPVGKKIGLTSKAVQQQLGVDQPDFGMLFDQMEIKNGASVDPAQLMQARVEAEFALLLKEDILSPVSDPAELLPAIDKVLISLEVVGSRIAGWDIRITDTIADNASASHFVLGEQAFEVSEVDMVTTQASVFKNGELASEGIGEACMGSPINACQWLANAMVRLGNPLKKGELILTGALGPMVSIGGGDKIKAVFEGLGELSFEVK